MARDGMSGVRPVGRSRRGTRSRSRWVHIVDSGICPLYLDRASAGELASLAMAASVDLAKATNNPVAPPVGNPRDLGGVDGGPW